MPHRKSRALASLALAAALTAANSAHAAPAGPTALLDRLAALVERAWSWVAPGPQRPVNLWDKEGPSADPDGQPRPGVVVPPEPDNG